MEGRREMAALRARARAAQFTWQHMTPSERDELAAMERYASKQERAQRGPTVGDPWGGDIQITPAGKGAKNFAPHLAAAIDALIEAGEGGVAGGGDLAVSLLMSRGVSVAHVCADCLATGRVRSVGQGGFTEGTRAIVKEGMLMRHEQFTGWLCDDCYSDSRWDIDILIEPEEQ